MKAMDIVAWIQVESLGTLPMYVRLFKLVQHAHHQPHGALVRQIIRNQELPTSAIQPHFLTAGRI